MVRLLCCVSDGYRAEGGRGCILQVRAVSKPGNGNLILDYRSHRDSGKGIIWEEADSQQIGGSARIYVVAAYIVYLKLLDTGSLH